MALFKKSVIYFFSTVIFFAFNFAEAKQTKLQIQTVNYTSDLQADLFKLPTKKLVPAVILIHGGYWTDGSRKELSDFATKLANDGFLAMTVDYHLLPKYTQQNQTEDTTNAIWWLRENSERLGINPSKIGAVGISAGGYLAAWAATHDEINSNGIHSLPNAAVSLYGPWDLTKEAEKEIPSNSIKLIEDFCAGVDRNKASPRYAISKTMPPVLLIHGDADKIVPVSQSVNAYNKLKSLHCKCKLVIVHNDGHCFPNTKGYFNAMKLSIKFLDGVLK